MAIKTQIRASNGLTSCLGGSRPVCRPQKCFMTSLGKAAFSIGRPCTRNAQTSGRAAAPGLCRAVQQCESTLASGERVQVSHEHPILRQAAAIESLLDRISATPRLNAKVELLLREPAVAQMLQDPRSAQLQQYLNKLSLEEQFVLLSLPAIGQGHVLQQATQAATQAEVDNLLDSLTSSLLRVQQFYDSIGGIPGYQLKSLQLIIGGTTELREAQQAGASATIPIEVTYHVPQGLDLAGESGRQTGATAAAQGLSAMPFMAEIYPVGGAGDRLGLHDEMTGECLPAAMLPYAGRTMMEGLVRDLQAREFLYYKLTGRQITTPVAIMTSDAKGNHQRITTLMENLKWMGRGPEAFKLFRQPLVPVLAAEDGKWLLNEPLKPMLKPGGHGAIWKLMWDEGVFNWLNDAGCQAALVRQISNPIAGTDTTLLALAGEGYSKKYSFGFMSCDRTVGAAEGMNVMQERKTWVCDGQGGGHWTYDYGVTNVEYTEFERLGICDEATGANSKQSVFPANTNVLYVGLAQAQAVVADAIASRNSEQLMPGLIFNLKKKVSYTNPLSGEKSQVTAGRMETTMQNMADFLTDRFQEPLLQGTRRTAEYNPTASTTGAEARLSTFMMSNMRRKVTSSAKKRREAGSARIAQTPDGSFYDLQRNAWQILQRCGMSNVPEPGSPQQYLDHGPGFIFLFHPALGPLWDVISQKIVGGSLAQGSELVLEVAEARLEDVHVQGSLLVHADSVMGHLEAERGAGRRGDADIISIHGLQYGSETKEVFAGRTGGRSAAGQDRRLRYSSNCGRIQMDNVVVTNEGIDWNHSVNLYWKHQVARNEACRIVLQGSAEFEARDVTISGNHSFVVPDGFRMIVTAGVNGGVQQELVPLMGGGATWEWQYSMDARGNVQLQHTVLSPSWLNSDVITEAGFVLDFVI